MLTRLFLRRLIGQMEFVRELEVDVDARLAILEADRGFPNRKPEPSDPSPFATPGDKADAQKIFVDFRAHSERFAFDRTPDRITRFETVLKTTDLKLEVYKNQLRTLVEAIEDDISQRFFFHLPTAKTKRYFKRNEIWKAVRENFKSAVSAVDEAELCLVIEANNSAVYQAMVILERGLESLARELAVPYGIDHWAAVIQNIESEIGKLEKKLPRGAEKGETLTFYSQAALEFRYFKDAWRNHVAHARAHYDEHQALGIVSHVHDFMTQISKRLSEAEEEKEP